MIAQSLSKETKIQAPQKPDSKVGLLAFGTGSLQELRQMKRELIEEKERYAGKGRGANARAVTARSVLGLRSRLKNTTQSGDQIQEPSQNAYEPTNKSMSEFPGFTDVSQRPTPRQMDKAQRNFVQYKTINSFP
jgi:hypothetical protein